MPILTPWLTLVLVGATDALDLPKSFLRGSSKPLRERKTSVSDGVYTVNVDFDARTLINVNFDDIPDQIQLDSKSTPFDFIWVAKSGTGTIVKVRTTDGKVLGEYRSTPSNLYGNPSRTTVDQDGSVWLTNRNDVGPRGYGTIVHIGLVENGQCEDWNGDGVIDTSTGLGDIKDWSDASGTRGVATAQDECIVHYLEVNSKGTRHVAIDAQNDVWVSGSGLQNFDLVKGGRYDVPASGTIIRSEMSVRYGGYGGLMDNNGVMWSARPLLRWNVADLLGGSNGNPDPSGPSVGPPLSGTTWSGQNYDSYGLCIDSSGNVWNTQLSGSLIRKYAPDGSFLGAYNHGSNYAQGCVVDSNGGVWVAHSLNGPNTVGHLSNDGTFLGNVEVAGNPTGVAVDRAGKVWSTNYNTGTLSRIDPTLGLVGQVDMDPVGLGANALPYNYGDMTGSTNIALPNSGSWTILHNGPWKRIVWTAQVPEGNSLVVEAHSSADGGAFSPWVVVDNGGDLTGILPVGPYLEVRVIFTRVPGTDSPILFDLAIRSNEPPDCTKAIASPAMLWPPNHKFVNIGISGVTDPEGQITTNTVTSISQDEPLESTGDGNFEPDAQGVGTATAQVRAEVKGNAPQNGRVYVIGFTAADEYGDSCTGSVQVCVPHDQKKPIKCTLDSPLYDSTTGWLVV